jgi:hypothetical protein
MNSPTTSSTGTAEPQPKPSAPRRLPVRLALAAGLLLVACAERGGVRPVDVAIYQAAPPRSYEFVATVTTQGTAPTRNEALAELRLRAAEVGADAVIVTTRGDSRGPLRGIAIRLSR